MSKNTSHLLAGAFLVIYHQLYYMPSYHTTYTVSLPWAIFCWLGPAYIICLGRFRRRGEAEEHLKVLYKLLPGAKIEIVFDLPNA